MVIYLDWNIIVDLFEQNFKEFFEALNNRNERIIVPFSSVHLMEGQSYNVDHREKDILSFISNISRNHFLFIDPLETKIIEAHPDFVNSIEKIKNEYFSISSKFNYSEIKDFSKQMGFHNQELNNYDYKLIIKKINEIIGKQKVGDKFKKALGNDVSFNNLIDVITKFIKTFYMNKFSIHKEVFTEKYAFEMKIQFSLYLLNALGYWQEKNNKINSYKNDAHHSVYAAYCEYFFTNDKKLYHKVKAIYHNFNIKTAVILFCEEYHKAIKLVSV